MEIIIMKFKHYVIALSVGLLAGSFNANAADCPAGSNAVSKECGAFDITQPDVENKFNEKFDRYDETSSKKCARLKGDKAWFANCQALSADKCAKEGLCKVDGDKCALDIDKVKALLASQAGKAQKDVEFPCPAA